MLNKVDVMLGLNLQVATTEWQGGIRKDDPQAGTSRST